MRSVAIAYDHVIKIHICRLTVPLRMAQRLMSSSWILPVCARACTISEAPMRRSWSPIRRTRSPGHSSRPCASSCAPSWVMVPPVINPDPDQHPALTAVNSIVRTLLKWKRNSKNAVDLASMSIDIKIGIEQIDIWTKGSGRPEAPGIALWCTTAWPPGVRSEVFAMNTKVSVWF